MGMQKFISKRVLISFCLILNTVIQLLKINFLNSVVIIIFMAHHFGVYIAITALEFVLLGEKL